MQNQEKLEVLMTLLVRARYILTQLQQEGQIQPRVLQVYKEEVQDLGDMLDEVYTNGGHRGLVDKQLYTYKQLRRGLLAAVSYVEYITIEYLEFLKRQKEEEERVIAEVKEIQEEIQ